MGFACLIPAMRLPGADVGAEPNETLRSAVVVHWKTAYHQLDGLDHIDLRDRDVVFAVGDDSPWQIHHECIHEAFVVLVGCTFGIQKVEKTPGMGVKPLVTANA